jgi:hypothetical protein
MSTELQVAFISGPAYDPFCDGLPGFIAATKFLLEIPQN